MVLNFAVAGLVHAYSSSWPHHARGGRGAGDEKEGHRDSARRSAVGRKRWPVSFLSAVQSAAGIVTFTVDTPPSSVDTQYYMEAHLDVSNLVGVLLDSGNLSLRIIREGADTFRKLGTPASPGTKTSTPVK